MDVSETAESVRDEVERIVEEDDQPEGYEPTVRLFETIKDPFGDNRPQWEVRAVVDVDGTKNGAAITFDDPPDRSTLEERFSGLGDSIHTGETGE